VAGVDVDDVRDDVEVILKNCFHNMQFDLGTAAQLVADYVVKLVEEKPEDEFEYKWWEEDD
jgi:hypothetical protein